MLSFVAGTRLAKKKELGKCLVHDDKTWKANFSMDLRLLHQLFTEQSYISLDVVRVALTSMPLDDKAREASNVRFKCLFEDAVGSRPDDVIAQMAVRASAHYHFIDVRECHLAFV